LAYYGTAADEGDLSPGDDACDSRWFSFTALPSLAFDHGKILSLFMERVRR